MKVKVIAVKDGKLSLSMKALQDVAAQEIEKEVYELPETEEATTTLGSLFANIQIIVTIQHLHSSICRIITNHH